MEEQTEAFQNPFSREKAWAVFQENMREGARLREEALTGRAAGGENSRELLRKAAEALGRLTDNTILERLVSRALEARDEA